MLACRLLRTAALSLALQSTRASTSTAGWAAVLEGATVADSTSHDEDDSPPTYTADEQMVLGKEGGKGGG